MQPFGSYKHGNMLVFSNESISTINEILDAQPCWLPGSIRDPPNILVLPVIKPFYVAIYFSLYHVTILLYTRILQWVLADVIPYVQKNYSTLSC